MSGSEQLPFRICPFGVSLPNHFPPRSPSCSSKCHTASGSRSRASLPVSGALRHVYTTHSFSMLDPAPRPLDCAPSCPPRAPSVSPRHSSPGGFNGQGPWGPQCPSPPGRRGQSSGRGLLRPAGVLLAGRPALPVGTAGGRVSGSCAQRAPGPSERGDCNPVQAYVMAPFTPASLPRASWKREAAPRSSLHTHGCQAL